MWKGGEGGISGAVEKRQCTWAVEINIRSVVVNHLQAVTLGTNAVAMCIFCNHKEHTVQTYVNLIVSLLKQLVQECSTVSPFMRKLYDEHFKKSTHPSVQEFLGTLKLEIDTFYSSAFIIVDALDEGFERARLVYDLRNLSRAIRLMVTSRDLLSIRGTMLEIPRLEIRARSEDIKNYIEARLSTEHCL
jgi:hypothetical protein